MWWCAQSRWWRFGLTIYTTSHMLWGGPCYQAHPWVYQRGHFRLNGMVTQQRSQGWGCLQVVVCLFFQRPVYAFQFVKNVAAAFQSGMYRSIDDDPQKRGASDCCVPNNLYLLWVYACQWDRRRRVWCIKVDHVEERGCWLPGHRVKSECIPPMVVYGELGAVG